MKKFWLLGSVAFAAISLNLTPARAIDWNGTYVGVHTGAGLGFSTVSDPYGASIFGDKIRTPAYLLGAQIGHNWQAPGSTIVWGIEADWSWLDSEGTNTCFAFAGTFTSSNCRARPDFTGTLTGRVGVTLGPTGDSLAYIKGGLAVLHNRLDATTNNAFGLPINTTSASPTSWGGTVGVGLEKALSAPWSVKLEYDYLGFANATLATPASQLISTGGVVAVVPGNNASVRQSFHEFKIGLNYRFDAPRWAPSSEERQPLPVKAPPPTIVSAWGVEVGARYWYSSGRFQKDLPPGGSTSSLNLISRLTYDDLTAHSGELYGRIDSPMNVFLKGYAGLGRITGGNMNDEDWGLVTAAPFTAYSNTLSSLNATNMNYATIDAGFDFFHGSTYKVGAFLGYNHIHEQYAATTCTQIASPSSGICSPPINGVPVITETDNWDSMRAGIATDLWVTPQWRVVADVAYLPYVHFGGVDNHWLRALVIDKSGHGRGVQTEAVLSYYVTPALSVGVGGRYWAMWTTSGSDSFNGVPTNRNDTFRYERWGGLLQVTYRFR